MPWVRGEKRRVSAALVGAPGCTSTSDSSSCVHHDFIETPAGIMEYETVRISGQGHGSGR